MQVEGPSEMPLDTQTQRVALPSLEEIENTVNRMETRFADSRYFGAYLEVVQAFRADLLDSRDYALARSAALMLIKVLDNHSEQLLRP